MLNFLTSRVKPQGQGKEVKTFGTNKNSKDMANVKVFEK
jgi:hypothetical protein